MSPPTRRAVFLDRDGVINRTIVRAGRPTPPASLDELEIFDGAGSAIRSLRDAGFLVIVVTNQPDVARGIQSLERVKAINDRIQTLLPIDDVKVCYHDDSTNCACRKPRPGMLWEAAEVWSIDLSRSFLVGDRWRDISAGRAAGCRCVLVGDGYGDPFPDAPDLIVGSLAEAAELITRAFGISGPGRDRSDVMTSPRALNVKLFADGADLDVIAGLAANRLIKGFTTNPTLMRRAGVRDYRSFSLDVLRIVPDRPVSFEVFSDDFLEMERQAHEIASWGENVFVKIPVTNTSREFSGALLRRLSRAGVQVNVTAVLTLDQVSRVLDQLADDAPAFLSIFAGRIADTGRDPVPIMRRAVEISRAWKSLELIWASPRELLNIMQAHDVGCHVITATKDLLDKLSLVGRDLDDYSLETVTMFRTDAMNAGYSIDVAPVGTRGSRIGAPDGATT